MWGVHVAVRKALSQRDGMHWLESVVADFKTGKVPDWRSFPFCVRTNLPAEERTFRRNRQRRRWRRQRGTHEETEGASESGSSSESVGGKRDCVRFQQGLGGGCEERVRRIPGSCERKNFLPKPREDGGTVRAVISSTDASQRAKRVR